MAKLTPCCGRSKDLLVDPRVGCCQYKYDWVAALQHLHREKVQQMQIKARSIHARVPNAGWG
jgi:hypothetical protein